MPQTKPRNPVLAALASLTVPGLGQLYNGQPRLAAAWVIAYLGATGAFVVRVFDRLSSADPGEGVLGSLGWVGVLGLLWLGGVVQAVFAALDRPDYELRDYNRWSVYVGAFLVAYVLLPLAAAFPLARWVMARNGIHTAEARAEWLARARGVRPGAALSRPAEREGEPVKVQVDIPDPAVAARGAITVIHLTVVGGPDGGIYDIATADRACSHRAAGDQPSWAGLYANPEDPSRITAVQFRVPVNQGESSDFMLSVNVGNLPDGRSYLVDSRRPWGENGRGSATVEPRGAGSVVRLTGTTAEGVRIEATVQCREVGEE
jgi:TM2 domain-containing membrane protein YozV